MNRDGSFNVLRTGLSFVESLDLYHVLLNLSWTKFYLVIFGTYLLTDVVFAAGFLLCGPDALTGVEGVTLGERFMEAFFFSVQTSTTVGYGHVAPNNLAADILVTLDLFVGLMGFALATGLLFARFSRPRAKIAFSRNAIIAPYGEKTAFEFRIANQRRSQLIEVEVKVLMAWVEERMGKESRRFQQLALERDRVTFFPLTWTVVHPIDEGSPLFGLGPEECRHSDVEFMVLLTGMDDTFSQTVHARSSYTSEDIIWGVKFADPYEPSSDGMLKVDLKRLNDLVKAET